MGEGGVEEEGGGCGAVGGIGSSGGAVTVAVGVMPVEEVAEEVGEEEDGEEEGEGGELVHGLVDEDEEILGQGGALSS